MKPISEFEKPIIKTELPGPKAREIIEADAQYVTPSYPRPDYKLVADHASGLGRIALGRVRVGGGVHLRRPGGRRNR